MVEAVNSRNTSGLFMTEKNFLRGLGEKVYNSSGAVIGAREATLTWVGRCVQLKHSGFDVLDSHNSAVFLLSDFESAAPFFW